MQKFHSFFPIPFSFFLIPFSLFLITACTGPRGFVNNQVANTPAVGFDLAGSDKRAVDLADSVMAASGGRYAWDQTRFIRWTFLGKRELVWDKWQNKVRIDFIDRDLKIRLNMNDNTGSVKMGGIVQTNPDTIAKYLKRGKSVWINDSYWLVMPFKMKDSGVTLKDKGKQKNSLGAECDVVELTFKAVGDTPQNKYDAYINPSSHLVTQLNYFEKSENAKPSMVLPFQDYRGLGNIMLSVRRGDNLVLTPMGVYKNLPDSTFTSFATMNYTLVK